MQDNETITYLLQVDISPAFTPLPNLTTVYRWPRAGYNMFKEQVGGAKNSSGAPPVFLCERFVIMINASGDPNLQRSQTVDDEVEFLLYPDNERYDTGVLSFVYISTRPDALRINDTPLAGAISHTIDTQVWSWIRNDGEA